MTETKALVLLFACVAAVSGIAGVALTLSDASGTAYGLVCGLGAALGGYVASLVVMHYGKLDERKEREEILLRR